MSMDRDANLVADIVELLLDLPDLPTSSSFTLQCRLLLCSTLLGQQEWRIMSVLQRLLERLTPALSHPYKSVRDRISSLLFCVFSQGTGLFYDGPCGVKMDNSKCPDLDKFVEYVLGELGSLQEYSGGNSSDGGSTKALLAAAASCPPPASQHSAVAVHHHHLVPGVEAMVAAHEVTQDKRGHKNAAGDRDGDDGGDGSDHRRHLTTSLEEVVTVRDDDDDNHNTDDQIIEDSSKESVVYSSEAASTAAGCASGVAPAGEKGDRGAEVARGGDDAPLPSPSFDCVAGETDERKNAFRIINTMCSFIEMICSRNNYSTPPPLYKMLGALCQLESVDSEQEVCSNCVSALCVIGQTLVRQVDILPLLHRIQDISEYRWWRARSAALGLLQMVVFHNALNMMACAGASELILRMVLNRLTDERVEVRNMAAQVLASLLHIAFVKNKDEIRNTFTSNLRKKLRGSWSSRPSEAWSSERLVAVHGAVLGLTAFVESAPYTVPPFLPEVLCLLANYINLPQPIAGSIRDSLSNFRRTHHDNWQEHKQHFTSDQLDTLNELLLSPSYYA